VQAYRSTPLSAHPVLVVVVHGDAPFNKPGYQYGFAKQVAARHPDVVAVGLLRPGYTDPQGHRSAGVRGEAVGDNYTPEVIRAVAAGIAQLKQRYQARQVVAVGHSGGAAIVADVLALYPSAADAALLVSCPCDVPRWRQHMQQLQGDGDSVWQKPVTSLSPQALVAKVARTVPVTLLVGTADSVTPVRLSWAYWRTLHQQNPTTKLVPLPGLDHEILFTPAVHQELAQLLRPR
jgi:alpha-beta hydrolase superfamily lysophospholipase